MKFLTFLFLLTALFFFSPLSAQETQSGETFGRTFNLGIGIGGNYGYYGYVGRTLPVLHLDYEFDVARDFTIAPFVNFSSYRIRYKLDNTYYYYHATVLPLGAKGFYYFDRILGANSNWDFYMAGSIGLAIVFSSWDDNYYGDKNYYSEGNTLFMDLHIGTEYHFTNRLGAFLDLSTGVSTIGISIH